MKKRVLLVAAAMLGVSLGVSAQSSSDGTLCIDALQHVQSWQKGGMQMVPTQEGRKLIMVAATNCLLWHKNKNVTEKCNLALQKFYKQANSAVTNADNCYKREKSHDMSMKMDTCETDSKVKWKNTCYNIVDGCAPGTPEQKDQIIGTYCDSMDDPFEALRSYAFNKPVLNKDSSDSSFYDCLYKEQKKKTWTYVGKLNKLFGTVLSKTTLRNFFYDAPTLESMSRNHPESVCN